MGSTVDLLIRVRAESSQAIAQLQAIKGEIANVSSLNTLANTKTLATAAMPASLALAGAGAGIEAGLGAALEQAASFNTMIVQTRNNTTMTTADMETMRQAILQLSVDGGVSLTTLAEGFRHIENFGFTASGSVQILDAAMKSAVSTGGDTARTAEVLAAVMKEFNLPANEAATAMDTIHLAAAEGNMTLEQFVGSFGQVAAIASSVGVPLDQAAAAMSALTRHGMDPAVAGTQIKDMIVHMLNPSKQAKAALESLSQSSGEDVTEALTPAELHTKGLAGVMDELHEAMNRANLSGDEQTAMWLKLIPNMRGGVGAFILAGNGANDFSSILKDMHSQMGITDEAFARMKETAGFQWSVLTAQVTELAIVIGNTLLPVAMNIVGALAGFVSALAAIPTPVLTSIAVVAAIGGGLLLLGGTLGIATFAVTGLITGFTALRGLASMATGALSAIGNAAIGAELGVAGLTGGILALVAAAAMMPAAGIMSEQGAGDSNQKILANLDAQKRAQAQAYLDAHMQEVTDAGGGQITQTGQHLVLQQWLKQQGIDETKLTTAAAGTANPASSGQTDVQAALKKAQTDVQAALDGSKPYVEPAIKTATEAKDNATANLQSINEGIAQRKADFDVAHVGAEQQALELKIQQSQAEQQLLVYKRQIEDIDRAAVDYAQQRKALDDADAVTKAKLSESPLTSKNADIAYQENLIKAQIAASRAGGPPVNMEEDRAKLRDLRKQDLQLQPSLITAQHNTELANRTQQTDSMQKTLRDDSTARAKIDVDEASQPLKSEEFVRARAVQDAQALLELDKQRLQVSEMGYQTELLLAQAAEKAAAHTLFVLQHPATATEGPPAPEKDVAPGSNLSLTEQKRLGRVNADYAVPNVQVNIDVTHTGDEDSLLEKVVAQIRLAWDQAKASNPVTGQQAGNYAGVAAR